jgi:hypothetical protein
MQESNQLNSFLPSIVNFSKEIDFSSIVSEELLNPTTKLTCMILDTQYGLNCYEEDAPKH